MPALPEKPSKSRACWALLVSSVTFPSVEECAGDIESGVAGEDVAPVAHVIDAFAGVAGGDEQMKGCTRIFRHVINPSVQYGQRTKRRLRYHTSRFFTSETSMSNPTSNPSPALAPADTA